jgi:mannosyltransferase OCH1-like enzyme
MSETHAPYMHRVWLGGDMPRRYEEYGEAWQDFNPKYKLWDWTEEEIMDSTWINARVLQKMYKESQQPGADMIAYYTHVADVVDYELVYSYGGWYFNTDLKPLKPLSTLDFNRNNAAFANEDDVHAVNMAMYAPRGNQVFEKIIKELPVRYFGMPGAFMNATTGVQLIMSVLDKLDGWHNPCTRFHRNVFNPIHWSEFEYGAVPEIDRDYPEETVAVHEWLHRTNQRGQRVLET